MSARPARVCRKPLGMLAAMAALAVCGALRAEPIVPRSADEVIETLPALLGERAEQRRENRRLRRALVQRPDDVELATQVARRELDEARRLGDPRHAGLALAALRPWPDAATVTTGVFADDPVNRARRDPIHEGATGWVADIEPSPSFDPKGTTFLEAVTLGVGDAPD